MEGVATGGGALAEQALSNLVNQFARPLDFLRELVQNAIDAGSPRIEVWIEYTPPTGGEQGVCAIHVDDFGEGMDEAIIDNQLTRLFASSKEDDLTKIGKFGIGFTSIFAIRPEAVLLRTGRHGEFWELLFHADRSFDKVRTDTPVVGTKITLYKRMEPAAVGRFVREARWILTYWCEHSSVPITFTDRTAAAPQATTLADDDPFAAFGAAPVGPTAEAVNRPLGLEECALHVEHVDGDVRVLVGYGDAPRYGFFNGGLTLVHSTNTDVLGSYARRLGHLVFKVKCDALEHTLTRDNVLQDATWDRVMKVVCTAHDRLRDALIEQTAAAAETGRDLDPWHGRLADEARARGGRDCLGASARLKVPLFRGHRGKPLSLAAIEAQESELGVVLLHPGEGELAREVTALGLVLVDATPTTRTLLEALGRPPVLGFYEAPRVLASAESRFVLPELLEPGELPRRERLLIEATQRLLTAATKERVTLRVGDFGGASAAAHEPLVLEGPPGGALFRRPTDTWFRLPLFLRRRCLLLNRHHDLFRTQVVAAAEDLPVAAYGLALAVLGAEGLEGEATYAALFELVSDATVGGAA